MHRFAWHFTAMMPFCTDINCWFSPNFMSLSVGWPLTNIRKAVAQCPSLTSFRWCRGRILNPRATHSAFPFVSLRNIYKILSVAKSFNLFKELFNYQKIAWLYTRDRQMFDGVSVLLPVLSDFRVQLFKLPRQEQ